MLAVFFSYYPTTTVNSMSSFPGHMPHTFIHYNGNLTKMGNRSVDLNLWAERRQNFRKIHGHNIHLLIVSLQILFDEYISTLESLKSN